MQIDPTREYNEDALRAARFAWRKTIRDLPAPATPGPEAWAAACAVADLAATEAYTQAAGHAPEDAPLAQLRTA